MQIDQRGGRKGCSGTTDNLLIDDMVRRDARYNKRDLSCAWIDVKKAFDTVSHSWMKKMLSLHRVPSKLQQSITNIIDSWNVVITIPMEECVQFSRTIRFSNGQLQGDSLGPSLYNLSGNPVAWKIRCQARYTLSKPISVTVTHDLFIDDLQKYDESKVNQQQGLEQVRSMMKDSGQEWNQKKSKVLHVRKGELCPEIGDLVLSDNFILKSLNEEDSYKFFFYLS